METCNAVGCFNPRHKSSGGYEYAYCYDHWLQRMEVYKRDDQPERKDEMARPKSDVCTVEGCGKPRMRNGQGEMLTMCDDHQREYWRKKAAERGGKKPSIGREVEVLPKEPHEKHAKVLAALTPINHDCEHCTAKATIEALRAKSPKLAKLIDAMQAEVEAAQELGL